MYYYFCTAQYLIITINIVLIVFLRIQLYYRAWNGIWIDGLLNLGEEQSIPTYVSLLNLLLCSILIYIIYRHEKRLGHSGSGVWKFLSIIFHFLSIDKSASIHEQFSNIHRGLVVAGIVPETLKTNRWIPFGIIFGLVVFATLIPFIRRLPKDTRRYFVIAGSVFVTGAVGFEYLGALMTEDGMKDSFADLVRGVFEEGFVMYGIAIFNCALYREILSRDVSLSLGG